MDVLLSDEVELHQTRNRLTAQLYQVSVAITRHCLISLLATRSLIAWLRVAGASLMAPTHRDPVDQNAHGSPGQQRYRSSSFSSDIPIPSSPSLYGVNGFEYRAPYATEQSPSNRPSMSHSASLPTVLMATDEDPFGESSSRRSSMSSTQGDVSTPKKQKSTYNHPYLIHSSSSAVLSRTNTSPSVSYTALPPSTPGHRASKSMGFLRSSQSVDDLRSPEKGETSRPLTQKERIQDGASGYTASYTPPVRRKLVNRYSVSSLSDLTQREEGGLENEQPRVKATGKLDMSVWAWKTGVQTETTMTGDLLVCLTPTSGSELRLTCYLISQIPKLGMVSRSGS